jgi:hypothetical protein
MAPPLIWQAPWLTPNCLNTATAAQSMIDAWNRQRQDQLGMHDTFHVKSYHKRFTEFMITACMVNGNNATVYHLPQYKGTHFRHNMQELAHQMINKRNSRSGSTRVAAELPVRAARRSRPRAPATSSSRRRRTARLAWSRSTAGRRRATPRTSIS